MVVLAAKELLPDVNKPAASKDCITFLPAGLQVKETSAGPPILGGTVTGVEVLSGRVNRDDPGAGPPSMVQQVEAEASLEDKIHIGGTAADVGADDKLITEQGAAAELGFTKFLSPEVPVWV